MHGRALAMNLLSALVFAVLALLAMLLFLGRIGNRGSARFRNHRVEFPPCRASLWSGLVIVAFLIASAVQHLLRDHSSVADWLFQGLLLAGALWILSTLPGTILVSDEGLEQIHWFRRRNRLTWDQITEVKLDSRTVVMQGDNERRIVHTGQQVDRARLLVELKHHCGDELPPEFPNPPQKSE
jgi:hypothetical protein